MPVRQNPRRHGLPPTHRRGCDRDFRLAGGLNADSAALQQALDAARPGTTITLRGGVYRLGTGLRLSSNGARDAPVTIAAHPGERPILDAFAMTTGYYAGWPLTLSCAFVRVRGLTVRGGPEGGVALVDAHDNVLESLDVHYNGRLSEWEGKGVVVWGTSSRNLILDVDSHHNADASEDNADGFQASAGPGNALKGCKAWRNSDDGYDLFNVGRSAPVVLVNCAAWENGYREDGTPTGGDGNGFKLGGHRPGLRSGGHVVTACRAWSNRRIGIDSNGADIPLRLLGNASYDNGTLDLACYGRTPVVHVIRNNVARGGRNAIAIVDGAARSIQEGNSWQA